MPALKILSVVLMKQLTTQHLPQAEIISASCLCGEPLQCVFFYLLHFITTLSEIANFIIEYFMLSKVYTDGVVKDTYTTVCSTVREIIRSLKLADYLLVQADET